MNAPPEHPIGPGGYPRDPGYGTPQKFGADLAVGIILIVLNAIGTCVSGLVILGGGILAGGGAAVNDALAKQGKPGIDASDAKAVGGMVLIAGIVFLLFCVSAIIGSVGIIKSARWGHMMVFVIGVLTVIISVVQFNPIGLVIGLLEAIFCGLRLFGNVGPKPAA